MYLKPCRNCPHKVGCEIKAAKLESLRGLGFTSANFKCDERMSELQPGAEVTGVLGRNYRSGEDYTEEDADFLGVVMRPYRNRVLVWILNREGEKNPLPLHPDRITPTGTTWKLCPVCQQPEGTHPDLDRFRCGTCHPYYTEAELEQMR